MKNIFDIEDLLEQLEDGRVNPTYKTETVTLIILMGFLLRLSSFSDIYICTASKTLDTKIITPYA